MHPVRLAIALCLVMIAVPSVAQVQMVSPMLYEGPRIALQSHANRFSSDARDAQPRTRAAIPQAAMHFTPSAARRAANLARFVSKTRAVDPRGADDLQKLFSQGDFIEKIGKLVAPYGLRIDNLADAYAMWWVTAWEASRGSNDTPSPATLEAVRRQAADAVSTTNEIAVASDAQKQELAEALWIQSALLDGAVEQARRDPSRLRAIGYAARQGAKGMGLNLDAIDLTSQGFVPVGVGQNDAPATTPKPGSAAPYGALALAAGGMGVGGFLMLRQRRS
ncbi:DUF6683 family protein [uncultured Sphingomonas sp.]|uniref:DUF6683 family protein n=1 Tax=uncultured Sphingomonas sp. TaxID=158754 RepID=UPI0025FA558B|nr:DUF6683 family protein [uncultured Sphingomonas sp.]